jgi:hypothetical protein
MSDQPKTAWTSIIPRLLGITVLAGLFLAGIRGDRAPESPFQQSVRRLRIGMTSDEVHAVLHIPAGVSRSIAGGVHSYWATYHDRQCGEWLSLAFEQNGEIGVGRYESRIVDWKLERH